MIFPVIRNGGLTSRCYTDLWEEAVSPTGAERARPIRKMTMMTTCYDIMLAASLVMTLIYVFM